MTQPTSPLTSPLFPQVRQTVIDNNKNLKLNKNSSLSMDSLNKTLKAPRKTSMRMQAKNWFLTFPQCATTKQQAMDNITKSTFGVKGAIVAQEKHADGNEHLHIAIFLEDKLRTSDPHLWDFICGKHGDYQTMKSISGTISYLKKEDQTPLVYGTIPDNSSDSQTPKSTIVANMINSGLSLDEIDSQMAGYFLQNYNKIKQYAFFSSEKRRRTSIKPLKLPILYTGARKDTQSIVDWLNTNLLCTRPFKQKQLYICSPPNYLKTTLMIQLSAHLKTYVMPLLEDFYDSYNDDMYDIIFFDEYKSQKTITFLNSFLQGSPINLKVKGAQIVKTKNLPCVFFSNYLPKDAYHKEYAVETLMQRLQVVELESPLDLENVQFQTMDDNNDKNTDKVTFQKIPVSNNVNLPVSTSNQITETTTIQEKEEEEESKYVPTIPFVVKQPLTQYTNNKSSSDMTNSKMIQTYEETKKRIY